MGKTFQKVIASSAGGFGANSNKIPQWISANGGEYKKEITSRTTHLITTNDAYKKNIEPVQEAKRLGSVKIVSFDWLEDSLLSKSRNPKREGPYLLEGIIRGEQRKADQLEKAEKQKLEKRPKGPGRKVTPVAAKKRTAGKAKKSVLPDPEKSGYHVYTDVTTGVMYSAILTRQLPSRRTRERFQLKVYESETEPHVYGTHAKYSRVGHSWVGAPLGSTIGQALIAFEKACEDKTGIKWEDRSNGSPPSPSWPLGLFCYEQSSLITTFLRQAVIPDRTHDSGPEISRTAMEHEVTSEEN